VTMADLSDGKPREKLIRSPFSVTMKPLLKIGSSASTGLSNGMIPQMADENDDMGALLDSFIQHKQMELRQSYLSRGRRFKDTADAELRNIWASAYKVWVHSRSRKGGRDFHDAEVELTLRGMELPNEMVQAEHELARHLIEHEYPNDAEWQAELQQKVKDFFELLAKPKN
jgi:hypothetical protein